MQITRTVVLTACMAAGLGFGQLGTSRAAIQTGEPRVIEVVARRFAFEPATIEATVGERLRLLVRSGDGPHGFEIKRFKVSKEIPRGTDPVTIDFTVSEAGSFPIVCSLFCGDGHADMKGTLVVSATAEPVEDAPSPEEAAQ